MATEEAEERSSSFHSCVARHVEKTLSINSNQNEAVKETRGMEGVSVTNPTPVRKA
jgi:hypothetical protein